ncbi:Phytochelatin-domain-containing protein [Neocallimastix sp. 'constans']
MSFLTGVTNYLSQNKKPLTALLSLSNIKANYSHNSPFQYKNKFTLRAPDKQPPNEVMRRTVHGRRLPKQLINFGSKEGIELFKDTLSKGYANNYFALAGNFTTQSDPSYCGLGTLCMVLNAVEVDPCKRWKGIWRWWADDMLECCYSLEYVRKHGIDFRDFICLSRCNGLTVIPKRAENYTKQEFIQDVEEACQTYDKHIIISYSRKGLGQTGDDPSYWCDIDLLWKSLNMIDKVTGHSRGYFLVQKADRTAIPLCKFNRDPDDWKPLSDFYLKTIPAEIKKQSPKNPKEIVECILDSIPEFLDLFVIPNYFLPPLEAKSQLMKLVEEAKASHYYHYVDKYVRTRPGPGVTPEREANVKKLNDFLIKYPLKFKLPEHFGYKFKPQEVYELKIAGMVLWLMSLPGVIFDKVLSKELYSIYEKSHDPSRMIGKYVADSTAVTRATPLLYEEVRRLSDYQSVALHSVHTFIHDLPKACESLKI